MTSKAGALRARLAGPGLITAPGVYDMISARIADRMGFPALYMTGFGVVASYLGLPDAGLATYTDMVGRVNQICTIASTPLIADADTGYGGLLNVAHTLRGYSKAGAAAVQFEDQEFPKKCGHTPGRRVIPTADMVKKIRVAVEARGDDDILIVARTDARTAHGLDEALRRAEAYAKAGADILFVESPESEREMEKICASFELPLMANMVEGGKTPILSAGAAHRARLSDRDFSGDRFSRGGRGTRLRLQDFTARRLQRRRDRAFVSVQRFREAHGIPGRLGFR